MKTAYIIAIAVGGIITGINIGMVVVDARPTIKHSANMGGYSISAGWDSSNGCMAVWQRDTNTGWSLWTRIE